LEFRRVLFRSAVHRARVDGESLAEAPTSIEGINELLEHYYIYRDDLLNFVTCANLVAETADGVHPVWEAAAKEQTVQIVPLRELVSLASAYSVEGKTVWMVENSGVGSTWIDHEPDARTNCTHCQS